MIERNVKYVVRKSQFPDDEGTHLVVMISKTAHGRSEKRVYKGSLKECMKEKERLENEAKR